MRFFKWLKFWRKKPEPLDYYTKELLKRMLDLHTWKELTTVRPLPPNSGRTIRFRRYAEPDNIDTRTVFE